MQVEHRGHRAGFTLVELLVVIAIISVLIGLISVGVMTWVRTRTIQQAKERVQAIDSILRQHWDKVVADAKKETPSQAVLQLAGGDPARAQVIWIKARLKEAFPMSYAEIQDPSALYGGTNPIIPPGRQKYIIATYQKKLGATKSNNPATESAACLALALLSVNRGGSNQDVERYLLDTDQDGIQEFVDDWLTPLAFYRFPTANARLQSYSPTGAGARQSKLRDSLDPDGTLQSPNWNSTLRTTFEQLFHPIAPDVNSLPYYIVPTIVSAGGDKITGLEAGTMKILDQASELDNIYNFETKLGG